MDRDIEAKIEQRYRQASTEQPPAHLDREVLEAARRSVRPRARAPFGSHWMAGGAMAAVVVLSVLVLLVMPERPDLPLFDEELNESTVDRAADALHDVTPGLLQELPTRKKEQAGAPAPVSPAREMQSAPVPQRMKREAPAQSAPSADFMKTQPARQPGRQAVPAEIAPAAPALRFDMYETLPEAETRDRVELSGKAVHAPAAPAYLQVGLFPDRADALAMQTRIEELGLVAEIHPVAGIETDVYYRVRVGPYTDADALETARAMLVEHGVEAGVATADE